MIDDEYKGDDMEDDKLYSTVCNDEHIPKDFLIIAGLITKEVIKDIVNNKDDESIKIFKDHPMIDFTFKRYGLSKESILPILTYLKEIV